MFDKTEAVLRWIRIGQANGAFDHAKDNLPNLADIMHSALLARLWEGKDPFVDEGYPHKQVSYPPYRQWDEEGKETDPNLGKGPYSI